jgi:Phosphotransferase enzyme family
MNTALEKGLARIVTKPAALANDRDLQVVYVRRKPARGLVALHAGRSHANRMACVSIDERELRESGAGARVTLSWFPEDAKLRTLHACCEPSADRRLWEALERAACDASGSTGRLIRAHAEPLRYKPHDRCVLRYRLLLEGKRGSRIELSVVGKAYQRRDQASRVHATAEQLYGRGTQVVAQPLALVEALGVTVAEDVSGSPTVPGTQALRLAGRAQCPHDELRRVATALAVFHSCPAVVGRVHQPPAAEAAKVLERVDLLARSVPSLTTRLRTAGRLIAEGLVATPRGSPRLVHGSFKPSQLLFVEDRRVVVTDLDHCRLADPALDLGYFLAYLRPAALWHRNAKARASYETAATCLRRAYAEAMDAAGARSGDVESALAHAALYEAALLLKIASRRVHRLNSPRPHELEAILGDAVTLVSVASERQPWSL